ncbi:MAG: alpha/beta fold hydrolase [Gallionellaceae bacterium]|nr:alpha/beta fold hydrolase [Gallionellaceae bacterium]
MTAVLILAAALALLTGLNLLIRFGLRAPRVLETASLAQHGLAGREVRLPTVRGRHLFGWLLPGDASKPAPGVIVLHGWGANLEMMLPLARPMRAAGLTVLLIDARNHGGSDGDTFSSMPRFAEDLDAAVALLKAQPEALPEKIALVGHSVGAAAALLSASRRDDLAGVISLAAFAHPDTMMRRWLAGKGIPYVPLGWYVLRYVQRVIGHRFDAIAPVNSIARVHCPVLLVHGSEDTTVPVGDAQAIYARRPGDWVNLLVLPGEHDASDELEQHSGQLIAFLREVFAATAKGTPP